MRGVEGGRGCGATQLAWFPPEMAPWVQAQSPGPLVASELLHPTEKLLPSRRFNLSHLFLILRSV